jgi:queuosine precursor transporter
LDNLIFEIINWLQIHLSAEMLTVWSFLFCALAILGLLRFYGVYGLYAYNVLAVVIANIQVLRFTEFQYFSEPVALGTVLFTTTFFVNDVITEHYGIQYAKKSIMLCFWGQLLVMLWMLIALGHPLPTTDSFDPVIATAHENYLAMLKLFAPSLRILIASLVAYLCSQLLDILIFNAIKYLTHGKYLWLRQNLAMLLSGFCDTFLFSVLAWKWFSTIPISYTELIFTYVLSAQIMRMLLNVSFTPLMYMSNRYARVAQ